MKLKVPPLLLAILTAVSIWLLTLLLPEFAISIPWSYPISVTTAAIGMLIIVMGFFEFRRARTTVDPRYPGHTTSLVTTGIYRYTRNPMYLGMTVLLFAWAIYLQHTLGFILIPGFVGYMNRYQIELEEVALSEIFKNKYTSYKESVSRWI